MMESVRAGVAYFGIVFAAGFVLGTIRTMLLIPRLGETVSVLIELPIILFISWIVCGRVIDWFSVPPRAKHRFVMGITAFALLIVAELCLSVFLLGTSVAGHFENYRSTNADLGLAGQIAFAVFPYIRLRR
jgi:hypothetical protein